MMFKTILFVVVHLVLSQAFAMNPLQCPEQIRLLGQVDKIAKTSVNEKYPGWKEAQQALMQNTRLQVQLTLTRKTDKACFYKATDDNAAVLTTTSFHDSEEENPNTVDQLIVNFKLGRSSYVSFVPVKSYAKNGIQLYSTPFRLKIKTRLFVTEANQWVNFDLGMISIGAQ
jgi:hypothetical protein